MRWWNSGVWEPVRTTGLPRFSHKKEERGGGVGHGAGAMKNDKAVPVGILAIENGRHVEPVLGADAGGVDGRESGVTE